MFSLDVVRWRDKKQQQQNTKRLPSRDALHRPRSKQALHDARLEEVPVNGNDGDGDGEDAALPSVQSSQETQAQRDRRLKRLYGRTQSEMHDTYVDRVGQWMQTAATQPWAKDYAKHTSYSKQYVPRERSKHKEIGGPMLKTNLYSPRAVFKGGGDHIKSLRVPEDDPPDSEREQYQQAIRFIERSRDTEKEIQPPMSIPKNKRLECAHYFVEDVICTSVPQDTRPTSRKQLLRPLSPARHNQNHSATGHHFDPPPTTAEYVALPQWRVHSPHKWTSAAPFVSTVAMTNAHTAQNRSITGAHYAQSVLTSETFVAPHKRLVKPAKDAALDPRDHERRAHTAAAALHEAKSPRKAERKYFSSMWTQPGSPSRAPQLPAPVSPQAPPAQVVVQNKNNGRTLAIQLRETANRAAPSPRRTKQHRIGGGGGSPPVLVRPLTYPQRPQSPADATALATTRTS